MPNGGYPQPLFGPPFRQRTHSDPRRRGSTLHVGRGRGRRGGYFHGNSWSNGAWTSGAWSSNGAHRGGHRGRSSHHGRPWHRGGNMNHRPMEVDEPEPSRPRHRDRHRGTERVLPEPPAPATEEIPGFYFDPVRQKYFRIPPGGTPEALQVLSSIKPAPKRTAAEDEVHKSKSNGENYCANEFRKGLNLTDLLRSRETHTMKSSALSARISATRVVNLSTVFRTRLHTCEPGDRLTGMYERLTIDDHDDPTADAPEACQFLLPAAPTGANKKPGTHLIGAWSTQLRGYSRIMCMPVAPANSSNGNGSRNTENREKKVVLETTGNYIFARDRHMTDLCVARLDSDATCIVYATMPRLGGGKVFLQPLPELSHVHDDDCLMSPIYNMYWSMDKGVWSVAWDSVNLQLGFGLENRSVLEDVMTSSRVTIPTDGKCVLSQRFNQKGNMVYMGIRGGDLRVIDLRTPSHPSGAGVQSVHFLPQQATTWLQPLSDDNYLVGATYLGEMDLLDVRMRKSVHAFEGCRNSRSKLPFAIDTSENLLFAASETGVIHGWSLRTGSELLALPPPCPVIDRDRIPRVAYCETWTGRPDVAGLVVGAGGAVYWCPTPLL